MSNGSSIFVQAIKILDDEVQCDIIKIGNLVRNKVRNAYVSRYMLMYLLFHEQCVEYLKEGPPS